ncbi:EF-hand domain-containing family member C2-like isoform X1 [Schistocerca gregaria]|uniref:EF-hand domain-containing family member C2-like isoform X1 n=1 Tax=Schistocerca gregaria TaxID=7010 RepID=UPI00211E5242|nr:EF-hand domain-containing family member C2-like isoform X1 [Schistocerca gregaria]
MLRSMPLPFLPGFTFTNTIGQTRFHKPHHFELYNKLPILSVREKPGIGGESVTKSESEKRINLPKPAEAPELPAWIAYDKQVLCFDGFFQESVEETKGYAYQIRKCRIYFYLEDGTVQVIEPKVINSGIPQGTLINRQRIPRPPPHSDEFYDILDFNVGREVELFGRVFKLTSCDAFTRAFLSRMGVPVPEAIAQPIDPYTNIREQTDTRLAKKPNRTIDTRGQFLSLDRKVLRFYGYWDDRESEHGMLHRLELQYFLADDTIAIKEHVPPNSGRDSGFMFCRRGKLPKTFEALPPVGSESPLTLLNVLSSAGKGEGPTSYRYVADALGCAAARPHNFYRDSDLAIGACINCFGRKVVLTDWDDFTKAYYHAKYGVGDIKPIEQPISLEDAPCEKPPPRELPPYNGYGSYEDSAGNCRTVLPTPPRRDFVKFLHKDRQGLDSFVLRFKAEMISKIPENRGRIFIISYFLSDDTMSVFEAQQTGFKGGMFYARDKMYKPGQDFFTNKEPDAYTTQDLFVGNVLNIHEFLFRLVAADEYALRYMEINSNEFPWSNIHFVMGKVREALKPVYKDFVCKHLISKEDSAQSRLITFNELRSAIKEVLGDTIKEHEIITLARHYGVRCKREKISKDQLRSIVHTELRRYLFCALDRMMETFRHLDVERTGFLPKDKVYLTCRASCVPLDKDVLAAVLERMEHNERGHISYLELGDFLNTKKEKVAPCLPDDYRRDLSFVYSKLEPAVSVIDFDSFLKDLDLEKTIVDQSS